MIRGDAKDIKSLPEHFPVLARGKQDWSKHCGRLQRAINRRELDGFRTGADHKEDGVTWVDGEGWEVVEG
jgi:hypothetical protein